MPDKYIRIYLKLPLSLFLKKGYKKSAIPSIVDLSEYPITQRLTICHPCGQPPAFGAGVPLNVQLRINAVAILLDAALG